MPEFWLMECEGEVMDSTSGPGPPNLPGNPCYQFFLSREASEALLGAETQDEQMLAPE